ncbi:putative Chitin binding Peritrophin-A domain-containing protein 2 [Homarus americanus]|uniref:Putative Chitin binding Peritrophin-A domain-containing protein 2 n=1 Tax=Homarus americanus TaxID=6706 RepID=A0A8J5JPV0_HOMAM|nr:putative Chitin binding Peritrophin-A domain-containing protein 2 [Homarus americanus]
MQRGGVECPPVQVDVLKVSSCLIVDYMVTVSQRNFVVYVTYPTMLLHHNKVMGRLWFFLVVTLMAASSFYVEAQLTEPCTTEDASACADGVLNNIFQLEPVASDCSTYCKCTGQGRGIVLACPPLLFFDKSLRVCSFQRNC